MLINHSERSHAPLCVFSHLTFNGYTTNILQFHWFKTGSLISPSAYVHPPCSCAPFPSQRASRLSPFLPLLPARAANFHTSCAKVFSHPTPASREWGRRGHQAVHCGRSSNDKLDACASLRSGNEREHLGRQAGAAA